MNRKSLSALVALLVGVMGAGCGSAGGEGFQQGDRAGDAVPAGPEDELLRPLGTTNPPYCWAQIERPYPADLTLKIGTPITLRTGGPICPEGMNEKLAYRFYLEKVDKNGNILAPRVSPQGLTEWSLTKSPFDTSNLTPGRYRVYMFSLPRTMINAWKANDPAARNRSTRSGNAYVNFVTTGWDEGSYGSCSAMCGDGVQTRTVACKDSNGDVQPDSWCEGTKPDGTQACNAGPCTPPITPSSITLDGWEDFMITTTTAAFVGASYQVTGKWKDAETAAYVQVQVAFQSMPTSEGDYDAAAQFPTNATSAYVIMSRRSGATTTSYASTASGAKIKVRKGDDDKLHVIVDDPALASNDSSTIGVRADITLVSVHIPP
jgi:hypothetical protein